MRKSTRIWMFIAAICIGAGIILSIIGIVAGASGGVFIANGKLNVSKKNAFHYESEYVKDIKNIEISVSNSAVEIIPSDNSQFKVEISLTQVYKDPEIEVENGRIYVNEKDGHSWFTFNLFDFNHEENNYVKIYVPKGATLNNVDLGSSNGNITSDTDCKIQDMNCHTSNGRIELNGITCQNSTILKSSNGKIICNGNFYKDSQMTTSNGAIELTGTYEGKLRAKSSNGRIEFSTNKPESYYDVSAETSNGSIRLNGEKVGDSYRDKNNAANSIDLDTSNGSITMEFK